MAKDKRHGPILGAKLIESLEAGGEVFEMPTYEDLRATYLRSTRGYRMVKGYEALLMTYQQLLTTSKQGTTE